MKIFISGLAYDSGNSGISDYMNNSINALAKLVDEIDLVLLESDIDIFPKREENINILPISNEYQEPFKNMFWHLFKLPFAFDFSKYDAIFLPAANRRVMLHYPKPTLATVHDLSQYHIKHKYDRKRIFYIKYVIPFFLKRVDKICSISENTKSDIVKFYGVKENKIFVNHNGCDVSLFSPDQATANEFKMIESLYDLKKKYILYIARIEHPGKNHIGLIKAYEMLPQNIKDEYDLVFVGKDWDGASEVHEYANESNDSENIKFLGFVYHDLLPIFYRNATLYVFPSLYEGFGIPLLETMASGTPAICSNSSSLPEIGKDAVIYFNPSHISDMSGKISQLLNNKNLREELAIKGLERVKEFSWESHANRIFDELNKLVDKKSKKKVKKEKVVRKKEEYEEHI
jgi:glycosyltransferase involved in cell wall biosynthesis